MLSDETVLVVMSEMGRTPQLNGGDGRDHWPYTSVMMVGPKPIGDRVVGAFDDVHYGVGVDPTTAEVDAGALVVTPDILGATLLALADIDPAEEFPGIQPLTGMFQ